MRNALYSGVDLHRRSPVRWRRGSLVEAAGERHPWRARCAVTRIGILRRCRFARHITISPAAGWSLAKVEAERGELSLAQ